MKDLVCPYCMDEKDLIPLPEKDPSGLNETLGCLECGKERGLVCESHGYPMTNGDGNVVCLFCVAEEVYEREHDALSILEKLKRGLPLAEWIEASTLASKQESHVYDSPELSLLRFLVKRAYIRRIHLEDLIAEMCV